MKNKIKLSLIPILILCIAIGAIKINRNKIQNNNITDNNTIQQIIIENENISSIEETYQEPIIEEKVEEESTTIMYTTTAVNIRKNPSLEAEILKTVPINTEIAKIKVDENNWAEIKVDNEKYYIKNSYLSEKKQEIKISKPSTTSRGSLSIEERKEKQNTTNSKSLGKYTLTAYCGCSKCCGKDTGITASGAEARANHTIAAPSNFSFGTKLKINGIVYTVEDRGGAIKGNKIDIYFNSHSEALAFGRQQAEIFLVD